MMCERYWREGIVLVERGLDDPHRDGCAACTRAHASRRELVEALPLIGAGHTGDPHWQVNVWRRIDEAPARWRWRWQPARMPRRRRWCWRWQLDGVLVMACAVALWLGLGRTRSEDARPWARIIPGDRAMRATSAHVNDRVWPRFADVDDRLQVTVGKGSEVWIYRAERLVLQCRARQVSDSCAPDAHGMIVAMVLPTPGTYHVIVVDAPVVQPRGKLDEDRAALESVGADYSEHPLSVR